MFTKSSTYYEIKPIGNDYNSVLSFQLRTENNELKSNPKDYPFLQSKMIELENNYKILHDQKISFERDYKFKYEAQEKDLDALRTEIKKYRLLIDEKLVHNIMISSEIKSYKDLIELKDKELEALRGEYLNVSTSNAHLSEDINRLKGDLAISKEERNLKQGEVHKAKLYNDALNLEKKIQNEKILKLDYEVSILKRKLYQADDENKLLGTDKKNLSSDLDMQKVARINQQKEAERLYLLNAKLAEEKRSLEDKSRELELNTKILEKKILDTNLLIDAKEREIRDYKKNINYSGVKNLELNDQLKKLFKEKETFELLMNQYKSDGDLNKKMKEEQLLRSLELEDQKKKLEVKYTSKELEALRAKQDLLRLGEDHSKLREEHVYLNQELEALKNHANVLENQNFSLHSEIDNIVNVDQKVRMELDRKYKYQSLKERNIEELQKSAEKVRFSTSPKKL